MIVYIQLIRKKDARKCQTLRLFKKKRPSEEKKSEQEVCPFLEYTKPSGPGVYHLGGLWCTGVAFHRKITEEQANDFCLSSNYVECFVVKSMPAERKASIKGQVWSFAKLKKARKWLSKHQRGK